jgi:hypothetical protein
MYQHPCTYTCDKGISGYALEALKAWFSFQRCWQDDLVHVAILIIAAG